MKYKNIILCILSVSCDFFILLLTT